jgi:hypothetical protein
MRNVAMIDWLAHIFLYMKLNASFHASVDQQHYTLPVSDVDPVQFKRKNIEFN